MSTRRWPDTLPYASAPGYDLTPIDPAVRTAMEVGAKRARRITFADLDTIGFEWRMTDAQMLAFRQWHKDEVVSLAGASDDLAGWTLSSATRQIGGGFSPEGIAVDRLLETATTAVHQVRMSLPGAAVDGLSVLCRATIKAVGRTKARVYLIDRGAVSRSIDVNFTTGTLSNASNMTSATISDRGDGWWRITWIATSGTGVATPSMRIGILDDSNASTFLGDITKGLDIAEVQARIVTGYDLFVPSDAAGKALGASAGTAWAFMPVVTGGGLRTAEARFTGPYDANAGPGLIWSVKAKMEVRNA